MEYGPRKEKGKTYGDLVNNCDNKVGNLQPGQTYKLRMLKKNVGGNVQLNTWVNNQPHCSWLDTQDRFLTRKAITKDCPAIDQMRIDGWPEPEGTNTKYVGPISSGPP